MRRTVVASATIALTLVGVVAFAAGQTVSSGPLAADEVAIPRCTTLVPSVAYTVSSGNVTSVTISDIDDDCTGGTLRLRLVNSSGVSVGSATPTAVPGGPSGEPRSMTLAISETPSTSVVGDAKIVIEGP